MRIVLSGNKVLLDQENWVVTRSHYCLKCDHTEPIAKPIKCWPNTLQSEGSI